MNEANQELQDVLDELFANQPVERVLEAGCGSASHVRVGRNPDLTGIDISEKQLARNIHLNERILGDIQRYDFQQSSFDAVICWDVLEHVPEPVKALENFVQAVRETGLIILAFPNVFSMKGMLTKYTPFGFHVWVRRRLFGEKQAGTEDFGPFPVFMRYSIAPAAVEKFASDRGLIVEFVKVYESEMHQVFRQRHRLLGLIWRALGTAVQTISLGRIAADLSDCMIVIRKPRNWSAPKIS